MAKAKSAPISIKNRDLLASLNALKELDKFEFKGTVLLQLTRLALRLKEAAEAIFKTRDKIAQKHFGGEAVDEKSPKFEQFRLEVESILDEVTELPDTTKLDGSENGLNLDENKIPISVLVSLSWLIDL